MATALVETTILTDALLKADESSRDARTALRRYSRTELPVYAIKEFRDGPLRNFIWFHNKLVTTRSFGDSIAALQRMSLTPRRYTTSTALEALRDAARLTGAATTRDLLEQYGKAATMDAVMCDRFRLAIRTAIVRSWRRRREITSAIVFPLPCYDERGPIESGGQLTIGPFSCSGDMACQVAVELTRMPESLAALKHAVDRLPQKRENQRRSKALRHLIRTPKREFPADLCRHLGDAVFVCLAPASGTVLTTNVRDLEPLAAALGKRIESP